MTHDEVMALHAESNRLHDAYGVAAAAVCWSIEHHADQDHIDDLMEEWRAARVEWTLASDRAVAASKEFSDAYLASLGAADQRSSK